MSNTKPNIIYIMSDDHAANAISAYGSRLAPVFKTPNIDRIANEGCRMDNCHCTNAICTPSRTVILTGKSSHLTGVRTLADSMDPNEETYPKMMKKAGYQTAMFGKWHVHSKPQGFDDFAVLPGQGLYFNPYFINKESDEWEDCGSGLNHQYPTGVREEGYVSDLITDKCLDWLENRDKDKPFMLMCHHKAPHDNFEYHPRYEHMFDDIEFPEPDNLWEDKSHRSDGSRDFGTTVSDKNMRRNATKTMNKQDYPTGKLDIHGLSSVERTKAAYQKYMQDYCRVVAGIDDNVGRLLDYLDQEGLAENTVVVYTSDQGMFLGEHDYIDKRWIYEEALRMPLLVRYPKEIPAGTVMDTVVSNLDFAPTLLHYTDLEKTEEMQGRSFRDVLKGNEPSDWENKMYNRYWMHMAHHDVPAHFGMRTKEYKIIFFYGMPLDATGALYGDTPAGWELYDLIKDPYENQNVYNDPAYAEIREQLKEEMFELRERLGEDDSQYPELVELINTTK